MMKEISKTLKKLRSVNNKTQTEIAELMGMSQSAYSRLENDPSNATIAQAARLAEIYDVDLAFLLGLTDPQNYYEKIVKIKNIIELA